MANMASASFSSNDDPEGRRQFYNDFIAQADRNGQANSAAMFQIYSNVALMLDTKPPHTDYAFTITCDDTTNGCSKKGFFAHMNDGNKRMNFCNKFFVDGGIGKTIVATETARGACLAKKSDLDMRGAQWTRSSIIVHECTHTNYVMGKLGA